MILLKKQYKININDIYHEIYITCYLTSHVKNPICHTLFVAG